MHGMEFLSIRDCHYNPPRFALIITITTTVTVTVPVSVTALVPLTVIVAATIKEIAIILRLLLTRL